MMNLSEKVRNGLRNNFIWLHFGDDPDHCLGQDPGPLLQKYTLSTILHTNNDLNTIQILVGGFHGHEISIWFSKSIENVGEIGLWGKLAVTC